MNKNDSAQIPNSVLYYGMPMTGKSTKLQKIFIDDLQKSHGECIDLVINLWQFLHRNQYWAKRGTSSNYVRSPHGMIPALPLPFDVMQWGIALRNFYQKHPHVRHVLIDECYCIDAVHLDALIMCCRDFYPASKVPVILGSIDFDSWHHRMSNIDTIRQMVTKSYHLNHKCMLDYNRVATRRLHIIKTGKSTWTPFYNEQEYNQMIRKPKMRKRASMISVCSRHYHLSTGQLNQLLKSSAKMRKKPTWHFVWHRQRTRLQQQAMKQIRQNKLRVKHTKSASARTNSTKSESAKPKVSAKKARKSTTHRKRRTRRTKRTRRIKSTAKRTRRTRATKSTRAHKPRRKATKRHTRRTKRPVRTTTHKPKRKTATRRRKKSTKVSRKTVAKPRRKRKSRTTKRKSTARGKHKATSTAKSRKRRTRKTSTKHKTHKSRKSSKK